LPNDVASTSVLDRTDLDKGSAARGLVDTGRAYKLAQRQIWCGVWQLRSCQKAAKTKCLDYQTELQQKKLVQPLASLKKSGEVSLFV
jgi:hypothetical protein